MSDKELIREQARLLGYVCNYSGIGNYLPEGWKEDCLAVLAEAERALTGADEGGRDE